MIIVHSPPCNASIILLLLFARASDVHAIKVVTDLVRENGDGQTARTRRRESGTPGFLVARYADETTIRRRARVLERDSYTPTAAAAGLLFFFTFVSDNCTHTRTRNLNNGPNNNKYIIAACRLR